jgi:hypothetical protein
MSSWWGRSLAGTTGERLGGARVVPELITLCVICGKRIYLGLTKLDATGQPVHEDCYAKEIKEKSITPTEVAR